MKYLFALLMSLSAIAQADELECYNYLEASVTHYARGLVNTRNDIYKGWYLEGRWINHPKTPAVLEFQIYDDLNGPFFTFQVSATATEPCKIISGPKLVPNHN
jgi:hypothetical protein